jgi:hypothetical protein
VTREEAETIGARYIGVVRKLEEAERTASYYVDMVHQCDERDKARLAQIAQLQKQLAEAKREQHAECVRILRGEGVGRGTRYEWRERAKAADFLESHKQCSEQHAGPSLHELLTEAIPDNMVTEWPASPEAIAYIADVCEALGAKKYEHAKAPYLECARIIRMMTPEGIREALEEYARQK